VRIRVDAGGFSRELRAAFRVESTRVAKAIDDEVKDAVDGLKTDLRHATEGVLGTKIANAWRGKFFANKGQSGGPAAFVWTKAPKIIDFFSSAKVVTPLGAAFAIPTDKVPRGPRGRRLTPFEVEARFNADLEPVKLPSGRIGLVIDVIGGRNGRGFRAATQRRRAQGRSSQRVLMFVLSRAPLRSRRLIDLDAIANRWANRIAANVATRLERGI
jgi:hypothetical protein